MSLTIPRQRAIIRQQDSLHREAHPPRELNRMGPSTPVLVPRIRVKWRWRVSNPKAVVEAVVSRLFQLTEAAVSAPIEVRVPEGVPALGEALVLGEVLVL